MEVKCQKRKVNDTLEILSMKEVFLHLLKQQLITDIVN